MSNSFVAQSHTPCNRCVRFAPAVASGHATLATKRTLLLTWAGLAPAGSHQLSLAHSFDDLIGDCEHARRDGQAERIGRSEINRELEVGGLLNRQIRRLGPFQYFVHIACSTPIQVRIVWSVNANIAAVRCVECRLLALLGRSKTSDLRPQGGPERTFDQAALI
jgi:hypothetical protein